MDETKSSSASAGDGEGRVRLYARGRVEMRSSTARLVESNSLKKGDVLTAARFAGVQAAKAAPQYLALLSGMRPLEVSVDFVIGENDVGVRVGVGGHDSLEIAMLALTSTTVTCLTIFDMCKSADRTMAIGPVHLDHAPRTS